MIVDENGVPTLVKLLSCLTTENDLYLLVENILENIQHYNGISVM